MNSTQEKQAITVVDLDLEWEGRSLLGILWFRSKLVTRNRIKEATARCSGAAARDSRRWSAAGFDRGGRSAAVRGGGGVLLGQGFACCLSCD
ncbi:hypothetical protein F2Q69_00054879 [Brassica cretica]|uniref:Uncharacterized protein n=1 Tax=Brassica cretica TaxID=69181 RepID=A0A8S9NCE6_BRACR|nr:hypothetical protein F2Q69_00054879 [Brassica cretica]